ncbi:hypothetical protein JK159_09395 [Weissella minor]|uniref:hypothetical protein n=1 Tax=Weissella minor TaxID=1620 RepID=UPI001BAF7ABE|nr:hypothetical protein [Weissella minor]MBS0950560.1 hypothetical protein [Weissella minor]
MSEDNLEVVSQEMIDELDGIKRNFFKYDISPLLFLNKVLYGEEYPCITKWYENSRNYKTFDQIKLIKHVYQNEPQFKAEKPKKWIVRTKNTDDDGAYWYIADLNDVFYQLHRAYNDDVRIIVKFDTREEAEEYSTPQCEVVELNEDE